ncbi:MAG: sugar fermentation stimulation protein [bacterium]|nr:sugar fermentation stimulation protein [bacterium]
MQILASFHKKNTARKHIVPAARRITLSALFLLLAFFAASCGQRAAQTSSDAQAPEAPLAAVRINREAAGIAGITSHTADSADASASGVFGMFPGIGAGTGRTDDLFADASPSEGSDNPTDVTSSSDGTDTPADDITSPGGANPPDEGATSPGGTDDPADGVTPSAPSAEPQPGDPDFRVHGIYVTAAVAGIDRIHDLIALADETEINAFVIDIKDDLGRVTYPMDTPLVQQIGSSATYIPDIESLVAECKEHGIYLIARIVTFKDPYLAKAMPEYALHEADGTVFYDNSGLAWVNPYEQGVWDYMLEIAAEAARIGFDEIQFDYIRFSTDSGMERVVFGENAGDLTKTDIINAFTDYAYETLSPYAVSVSADVYGTIIDNPIDRRIVGQDYAAMASQLDVICPMVYPSHYGAGVYRIDIPDAEPYRTVSSALNASRAELDQYGRDTIYAVSENGMPSICRVRPWLQAFTATWVRGHIEYGREQIQAQLDAVRDAGYDEWLLWNATVRYDAGWF